MNLRVVQDTGPCAKCLGGRIFRYSPGRDISDSPVQGVGSMLPVSYDVAGVIARGASIPPSLPALASALANTPAEQQRTLLGESLYPLVHQLEHEHAAKVTGMLLEMDQTEVRHLLESPDALKAKVAEAMKVLRSVHQLQQQVSWWHADRYREAFGLRRRSLFVACQILTIANRWR